MHKIYRTFAMLRFANVRANRSSRAQQLIGYYKFPLTFEFFGIFYYVERKLKRFI